MATLPNNFDLHLSDCGKEAAFTNTNVALVKVRHVVEAINLVNSLHAAFFNHWFGTTRAFFSGLKE